MQLDSPLQLVPEYRDYVWGGQRLRPGQVTAEAWVLYEGNRVAGGVFAGKTLAELAQQLPAASGSALLLDIGSTTCDLIPLVDGRPALRLSAPGELRGVVVRREGGELVISLPAVGAPASLPASSSDA